MVAAISYMFLQTLLAYDYGVLAAEVSTEKTVPMEGTVTFNGNVQASGTVSIVGQSDGLGERQGLLHLLSPMDNPFTVTTEPSVAPRSKDINPPLLAFPSVPLPSVTLPAVVLPRVTPFGATSSMSFPPENIPYFPIPSLVENKIETGIEATNGIPFKAVVPASGKVTITGKFGPDGNGNVVNNFQMPSASVAYSTVGYSTVGYPTVANPTVAYPTVAYRTVAYPTVAYPTVAYPTVAYTTVAYSTVAFPSFDIRSVDCPEVMDYFYEYYGVPQTKGTPFNVIMPASGKVNIVGRY